MKHISRKTPQSSYTPLGVLKHLDPPLPSRTGLRNHSTTSVVQSSRLRVQLGSTSADTPPIRRLHQAIVSPQRHAVVPATHSRVHKVEARLDTPTPRARSGSHSGPTKRQVAGVAGRAVGRLSVRAAGAPCPWGGLMGKVWISRLKVHELLLGG